MSPEFIAVIGAAIALAAVILSSQRAMRKEISDMRQEMGGMGKEMGTMGKEMHQEIGKLRQEVRQEIGDLRQEMHQEIGKVHQEIGDLRERMARLEGMFEGFMRNMQGRQPEAAPSPQSPQ